MRKSIRPAAIASLAMAGTSVVAAGLLLIPAARATPEGDAFLSGPPEVDFSETPSEEELKRPERADYWAARAAYAARRAARRGEPVPVAAPAEPQALEPAPAPEPAPQPVAVRTPSGPREPSDWHLAALRQCESGGDYTINTGNGYYGAYQFLPSTWWGLGYEGYPHHAPPEVQDQAVRDLWALSGWHPWPGCSRAMGWL